MKIQTAAISDKTRPRSQYLHCTCNSPSGGGIKKEVEQRAQRDCQARAHKREPRRAGKPFSRRAVTNRHVVVTLVGMQNIAASWFVVGTWVWFGYFGSTTCAHSNSDRIMMQHHAHLYGWAFV